MTLGTAALDVSAGGLDEDMAARLVGFRAHLATLPLAAATRRAYAGRVAGYLAWLAGLDPVDRRGQGDPFRHGSARDYTVRDYRSHLILTGRRGRRR